MQKQCVYVNRVWKTQSKRDFLDQQTNSHEFKSITHYLRVGRKFLIHTRFPSTTHFLGWGRS